MKGSLRWNDAWFLLYTVVIPFSQGLRTMSSINNLEGKAGFRKASLHWKYLSPEEKASVTFRIRYCELHAWGLHRCRYQMVGSNSSRNGRHDKSTIPELNEVSTEIAGLRMATNYSFQVVPQDPELRAGRPSQISLQTKGFSAVATQCLADSSEVAVETGPFFGGRISVDESEQPGCFVTGDPQSSQTQYVLRIQHSKCGSNVNGSKVFTTILVQENLPILTHSTRKFVVVCSFSPESFIVKTGVSLPRETSVAKSIDFSGIIRLSPQGTNLLIADKNQQSRRTTSMRDQSSNFTHQKSFSETLQTLKGNEVTEGSEKPFTKDPLLNFLSPVPEPIKPDSRRQSRAYFHQALNEETTNGRISASAAVQHPPKGYNRKYSGWEGFLVLGLVSVGIIASISSLVWFVKSYRTTSSSNGDSSSESSSVTEEDPASISSLDSFTFPPGMSDRVVRNLDTRSELEVELDFEFSEEKNARIALKNNSYNPSSDTNSADTNPANLYLQLEDG